MKQIFDDFWRINLGHVAVVALFLFGLGVSWSQQNSKIELLDQRESARNETITTKVETNFAAIALRLEASERWQKDAEVILKAIESLRIEQRYSVEALKELKGDIRLLHDQIPFRKLTPSAPPDR